MAATPTSKSSLPTIDRTRTEPTNSDEFHCCPRQLLHRIEYFVALAVTLMFAHAAVTDSCSRMQQ
jgi:hypothetical protein